METYRRSQAATLLARLREVPRWLIIVTGPRQTGMHTQLIEYTRDPEADGYGIYLVFWFGDIEGCRTTPRSGPKPGSSEELRQGLVHTLAETEHRKIFVCVIDVSKARA